MSPTPSPYTPTLPHIPPRTPNKTNPLTRPPVFAWYTTHSLAVTPINPVASAIKVADVDHPTKPTLTSLESPAETSVSIITGPGVTLKALAEAKDLGITAVFLQPGTYNDESLAYAEANFATVLAGEGGTGPQGWCVLADGERGLKAAGKA